MVATDGHRLAYVEAAPAEAGVGRAFSRAGSPEGHGRDCETGGRRGRRQQSAHSRATRTTCSFEFGHRLLITRKLTGNFPDYERVLPKDNTHMARLRRTRFARAIERVAQFADERSRAIRVQFTAGEVKVFSSSVETGESEESVTSEYNGPGPGDRIQCAIPAGFSAGDHRTGGFRAEGPEERRRIAARPARR